MSCRYFKNTYPDYNSQVTFQTDEDHVRCLIKNYVLKIQESKILDCPDIYVGNSGIAFMFLKIHQSEKISNLIPNSLALAQKYLNAAKAKSQHDKSHDLCSFLCGGAGTLAVSAVINYTLKDTPSFHQDVQKYEKGIRICKILDFNRDGSDELLFGRAGYLSGIYWINSNLPHADRITRDKVEEICHVIIESGRLYGQQNKSAIPLLYHCWQKKYLGAAHGLCSILHMILESGFYKDNDLVKVSIDKLLECQSSNGNFPPALHENADKLIHWCHGAPGVFYLFAKSYLIYQDEKYLNACLRCGDLVWQKGLLRKGPGICHGVAGNGYIFLILYRLTKDTKHLYRANKFMEFLTNETFLREARIPDRKFSLYEGLAGTVCFLVDLLDPEKAQFPFMDVFDDKF